MSAESKPESSAADLLGAPENDTLRTAPTVVDDEKNGTPRNPTTTAGGSGERATATATATPQPGPVEKIMTKLGLTPIMVMSMFKSVLCPIL